MQVAIIGIGGLLVFALVLARPRWGLYLLLPAVIFSPEFILGNVDFRRISIRAEDILFLGVLAGLALRGRLFQETLNASSWLRPVLVFMFVVGVATLAGLIAGSTASIPLSLFYILKVFQYFLFALCAAALIRTENQLIYFVWVFGITLAALALWMLFPVFGANPHGPRITFPFDPGGTQQSGVFGALAAVMCASLLLHWHTVRSHLLTIVLIIGLLASLGLLAASGGRAGAIGAVAALLYLSATIFSYRGTTAFSYQFQPRLLVFIPMLAIAIIAAVAWFHDDPRFQSGLNRIAGSFSAEGIEADTSLRDRLAKWRTFINRWQGNPILGTGVPAVTWTDNWYLRLLMETGMLGLVVWLWLMWTLYRTTSASIRRNGTLVSAYATGMIGLLIVICVASIFAEYFMTVRTAVPFWLMMGSGLGVISRERAKHLRESDALRVYGPSGSAQGHNLTGRREIV